MQRVRIGLTGLAAVFLVTMIAAAGFSPEQPADRPAADLSKREEPLAELGVAPGGSGSNAAAVPDASAVQQEAENALAAPPLQPMSSGDPVRLDIPPPAEGSIHL